MATPCLGEWSNAGLFKVELPKRGLGPNANSIALDGTDKNCVPKL